MTYTARKTASLGELIAAAFDGAARHRTDPRQVSRLATQTVQHILRRAGPIWPALPARFTAHHRGR